MLEAIFSKIGLDIVDRILGKGLDAFKAYENKQISIEELRAKMLEVLMGSAKDIEIAHSHDLASTYASFMSTMGADQSGLLKRMWALTAGSMLFVLLWHMLGIPFIVWVTGMPYPGSGSTVNWAYALLGGCLGMGPLVLRTGPGASDLMSKISGLINKK